MKYIVFLLYMNCLAMNNEIIDAALNNYFKDNGHLARQIIRPKLERILLPINQDIEKNIEASHDTITEIIENIMQKRKYKLHKQRRNARIAWSINIVSIFLGSLITYLAKDQC